MSSLHIVCWNVAGWRTTIDRITKRHGSLENWLDGINADILCLQEIKIDRSEIEMKGHEYGAKGLKNYDTFWSYPVHTPTSTTTTTNATKSSTNNGTQQQRKGLNGVATFVKKGLTIKASNKVFSNDTFDCEGRCLMTDHGSFVVFNVYVPFSGENHCRLLYKLKFLHSLRLKLQEQRDLGKHVILAGDLNVAPRSIDCFQSFRKIDMNEVMSFRREEKVETSFSSVDSESINNAQANALMNININNRQHLIMAINYFQSAWPVFERILKTTRKVEELGINNKTNGGGTQQQTKYRITVTKDDGKVVGLGKSVTNILASDFDMQKKFLGTFESCNHSRTREQESAVLIPIEVFSKLENVISVDELREVVRVLQPPSAFNSSLTESQWREFVKYFGRPAHHHDTVQWFHALVEEDDMVDSFAAVHPCKHARYTCWDQSTNRRYSNEGSRIDHILVDKAFMSKVTVRSEDLPIGCRLCGEEEMLLRQKQTHASIAPFDEGEESVYWDSLAALHAATCGGLFTGASGVYSGGEKGIPDALDSNAYQVHLNQCPHTGMVYTPPEYSDHIAVSLYCTMTGDTDTNDIFQASPLEILKGDVNTRLTQPHNKQSNITSFFISSSSSSTGSKNNSESNSRKKLKVS